MIKINATQTIDLLNFLKTLKKKELAFFTEGLPKLIIKWYQGQFEGIQQSENLVLSQTYFSIDALAVAMLHLGHIFPIKLPSMLYRLTHVAEIPKTNKVTVHVNNQLKPLLSFTSLKNPKVLGRDSSKLSSVILSWKPEPKLVIMSTQQIILVANAAVQVLPLTKLNGWPNNDIIGWKRVLVQANNFYSEKEYLVYLSHPISCTWKLLP